MYQTLDIDIETYSSESIKDVGVYKYVESVDFEILMVAYSFDHSPVIVIDLAQGEQLPQEFIDALMDDEITKKAHNATFERLSFRAYGYETPASAWECTMVKSAYCGFPLSLGAVSKAMGLGDAAKDTAGKALIRYFSVPVKPTKANGQRVRNFPHHDPEKWQQFLNYCGQDVIAEQAIYKKLERYKIPAFDRKMYLLDQKINDKGIEIDLTMASNAVRMDGVVSAELRAETKKLTGLENPNSPAQLKKWLGSKMQKEIKSLAKDIIPELIKETEDGTVIRVLQLRIKTAKSSVKKYIKMLECTCDDIRAHGLLQFYGAFRTGRWAGRLVQLQNLPQNHLDDYPGELEDARECVATNDLDGLRLVYDDVASVLSQLIRTTFVAGKDKTFAVADFSAIEARVIAWLAGEKWRLDVFNTTGKIYEASAAMMFDVPIEEVTKGSDLRAKGKVSELALGYQGGVEALRTMGGEKMGLTDPEMKDIVTRWREKSPAIVGLWRDLERCAHKAVRTKKHITSKHKGLIFAMEGSALTVRLPSGRKLFYQRPKFALNRFDREALQFMGIDQKTKQWGYVDTYGGKLTENVIQAIARDLLAYSMLRLDAEGYPIVMHVHDEAICEVSLESSEKDLETMCEIMGEDVPWAPGLPLVADGYNTPFYKKD